MITNFVIFVEGDDDDRFFKNAILPDLAKSYNNYNFSIVQYKCRKKDYSQKFIKTIDAIGGRYLFTTDMDNSSSVSMKVAKAKTTYNLPDDSKIVIVIKEIESWYLAGMDDTLCAKHRMSLLGTETIDKEQFLRMIPRGSSKPVFMNEILENFSINNANEKNSSFKYYYNLQKTLL